MPVVMTTAPGLRRSGHVYDDKTGIAYEFPGGRYERWIVAGERFIYCEPKKGYFGCGVIGDVTGSDRSGRLVAEVSSYTPFSAHVSIRTGSGTYHEQDPTYWNGAVYWAQGVRPITDATFEAILAAAEAGSSNAATAQSAPSIKQPRVQPRAGYATPEVARAVERYSVTQVMQRLRSEFPAEDVHEMPHSNPGYDIRVGSSDAPVLFVEVKGTQSTEPVFFLSEGERKFSCRNAERYRLEVVTGVDLHVQAHQTVHTRHGAVEPEEYGLKPTQWRGSLLPVLA